MRTCVRACARVSPSGAFASRGVQSIRAPKSNEIAGSLLPGEINSQYLVLDTKREDAHINHPACACPRRTGAAAEVRRSELPAEEPGGLKVRFHSFAQLPVMKVPARVPVLKERSWSRSARRAWTRTGCYYLFDAGAQPLWTLMESPDRSNIHVKIHLMSSG